MSAGKRIIVDKGFDNWLSQFSKGLGVSKKRATEKLPEILLAQATIIRKNYKQRKGVKEEWDSMFRF